MKSIHDRLIDSLPNATDPIQKVWIRLMLSYTPYYFSEPVDFKEQVVPDLMQLNVPSPDTLIQVQPFGDQLTVIIICDEATHGFGLYAWRDENEFPQVRVEGRYEKLPSGVYGFTNCVDPSKDRRAITNVTLLAGYETMFNMCLYYINVMPSRPSPSIHSRQTRRAAGRSLGYPLKATTEILIRQHPEPVDHTSSGGGGEKCHHEVKGHVRILRRGQPEEDIIWVKSHSRGNPALGVKRTKYKVETR